MLGFEIPRLIRAAGIEPVSEEHFDWRLSSAVAEALSGAEFWLPLATPDYSGLVSSLDKKGVRSRGKEREENLPLGQEQSAGTRARFIERTSFVIAAEQSQAAARAFSLVSGRPLVVRRTAFMALEEAIDKGADSITSFGELEDFSQPVLELMWAKTRSGVAHFGLIPYRRTSEALAWVARWAFSDVLYQHHRQSLILARTESVRAFSGESALLAESSFGSDDVQRTVSQLELLALEFHAKECCARFNAHVFCGRPAAPRPAPKEPAIAHPGCAGDGPCIWHAPRIPVATLDSTHVLAVSCGSLRLDNNLFDSAFGLGLNIFHTNARSLIAPIRFVVSNYLVSAIVTKWMRAGLNLGEVTARANAFLRQCSADSDCFVLLGDPDDAVDQARAEERGHRLDPRSGWPGPQVGPADLPADDLPLSSENAIFRGAGSPITEGIVPGEILELVRSASDSLVSAESVLQLVVREDNRPGFWPSLKYGRDWQHAITDSIRPCAWCGDLCTVYRRTTESARREILNCPRCGLVADTPEGTRGSYGLLAPGYVAPLQLFEIEATSQAPDPGAFAVGISLIHSAHFGWGSFETTPVHLAQCGELRRATMNVATPATAYPFSYWIRACWISAQGFAWLSRPLTVTNPMGIPQGQGTRNHAAN